MSTIRQPECQGGMLHEFMVESGPGHLTVPEGEKEPPFLDLKRWEQYSLSCWVPSIPRTNGQRTRRPELELELADLTSGRSRHRSGIAVP
ncbi:hypothetical protein PG996_005621 [Apiospora saccharicola]|uniref:Uncharacterized protein n=1 Tax=Apiospora saccharicola TaxID=335842 RepID=A0ABR1VR11_9PEZI